MTPVRQSAAGATRTCPHCRQTILESATVCPACKHHLRFDPTRKTSEAPRASFTPLRVDGTIAHPAEGDPWEYSVTITVRNERGEETTRHVASVGVVQPSERRSFTVNVEVFTGPAANGQAASRVSTPGVRQA